MNKKIDAVLREMNSWENGPVNELLGNTYESSNTLTKRIIMYGPTQVGKTTLIMDLIGIKPECQKDLEIILRGGAKAGNSSTSSAIVYNRWEEECFGILFGNINSEINTEPDKFDADGFKECIKSINSLNRDSSEKSFNQKGNIIYYYLPKTLFEDGSECQSLQIVDLPGFGEKNEKMRKNAEEIIDYLSGIVAGAIVVVKSENIQRLESDYKEFIDKHHHNHLAIAVSYAIKTSAELQRACNNEDSVYLKSCKTDKDIALKISKHYFDLIKSEGYVSFDDDLKEQIVFPVEQGKYLRENFCHLSGAFDESRKLLKDRIASMKNRTSIDACIEEFETRNKKLSERVNVLKEEKESSVSALENFTGSKPDIDEKLEKCAKKIDILKKQKKKRDISIRNMQKIADSFYGWHILSEEDAGIFWDTCFLENKDVKTNVLYFTLLNKINERICAESCECKDLYEEIVACVKDCLNEFDYDDFLKSKRLAHSKKWRENASFETYYFSSFKLQPRINELIQEYQEKSDIKFHDELEPIKKEQSVLKVGNTSFEKQKSRFEKEISDLDEKIKINEEQIKRNYAMRDNVKSVFIKHFKNKMFELEKRMEYEKDPEVTAALLIVKSSIYLEMKPYLEEE